MKIRVFILLLFILSAATITACSSVQENGVQGNNAEKIEQIVFPKDKVIEVKIKIDPADLNDMLVNPMQEEYKVVEVDYNGFHFDNVGLRTKGNSSLISIARQESDRYSFKISFDEYIPGQNLFGLKKINLNNSFSDPTYMREYLSYELFEEMGVSTPECSYVNVYINDKLWGLYLAVEQIDEAFLGRNFDNAHGALYKPDGEGSDLQWTGNDIENYKGLNLKSDKSNGDVILKMLDELNNGTDYEKYINVDEVLRYLAVNTVLVNLDSYQGTFAHNYYLYEENGIFHIIPWDLNMSFAGFNMGMNKNQAVEMLIDEPTMGKVSERPLVHKLLQVEEYKQKYHDYIKEIISGYLSPGHFENRVHELSELIAPHVKADPTKLYTYEEFQKSLFEDVKNTVGLIAFVKARVDNVKKQLDGTLPASKNGEGLGITRGFPGNRNAGERPEVAAGENAGENVPGPPGERPIDERIIPQAGNGMAGEQLPPQDGEMENRRIPPFRNGRIPNSDEQANQNRLREAIATAIALTLLIIATIFILRFGRNKL